MEKELSELCGDIKAIRVELETIKKFLEKFEKIEVRVNALEVKISWFQGALYGLTAISLVQLAVSFLK